jgi:hypothetical protein
MLDSHIRTPFEGVFALSNESEKRVFRFAFGCPRGGR